jgi:aromatic ring-opening dioxygenase catalytic subunit (LigB family)
MYPDAAIPCIQVSLSSSLDADLHLRIGRALAALKMENLLVLGSGFSFHNMQALMSKRDDAVDPRNRAFEDWLAQTCSDESLSEAERERRLANWLEAPHARYCHPREEHLLPLQVCCGLGEGAARMVFQQPVAGFIASAFQWR